MKKLAMLLCCAAMLTTLAGCKDAVANISNSSEVLIQVGSTKITKGDIYDSLKSTSGASVTIQLVQDKLAEKEGITVTEEMKKEAAKDLVQLKKDYGGDEAFAEALASAGFKNDEDYLERVSYPDLLKGALLDKYLSENEEKILNQYHPIKAKVIEFASQANADKALAALKDGEKLADVFAKYGAEKATYKGTEAIYHAESSLPNTVYTRLTTNKEEGVIAEVLKDASEEKWYITEITNLDPTSMVQEIFDELKVSATSLDTSMLETYLKKHNFSVYDIDIYNEIKTNYPSYLVTE